MCLFERVHFAAKMAQRRFALGERYVEILAAAVTTRVRKVEFSLYKLNVHCREIVGRLNDVVIKMGSAVAENSDGVSFVDLPHSAQIEAFEVVSVFWASHRPSMSWATPVGSESESWEGDTREAVAAKMAGAQHARRLSKMREEGSTMENNVRIDVEWEDLPESERSCEKELAYFDALLALKGEVIEVLGTDVSGEYHVFRDVFPHDVLFGIEVIMKIVLDAIICSSE